MIKGLSSKQWWNVEKSICHYIAHPKFKPMASDALCDVIAADALRKDQPVLGDELRENIVKLIRHRRSQRRRMLHRERAKACRR